MEKRNKIFFVTAFRCLSGNLYFPFFNLPRFSRVYIFYLFIEYIDRPWGICGGSA